MFKENFTRICAQKGESPTSVCQKIGLSNSMYSEWTDSSVPRRTTLIKLSNYLGCTVDDLLADNEYSETGDSKNMFWENFVKLCNQKGVKPNNVARDLNLSSATATHWKQGAIPNSTTIQKIADYFGVTVTDLLDEHSPTDRMLHLPITDRTVSDDEFEIIVAMRRQPEMIHPIRRLLGIPEPADKAAES